MCIRDRTTLVDVLPGEYRAGLSQLQLQRVTLPGEAGGMSVNGTVTINTLDESQLIVDWDEEYYSDQYYIE